MNKEKMLFLAPSDAKETLLACGVMNYKEFDVGTTIQIGDFELTAVFADHTVPAVGVIVKHSGITMYFSGDTEYNEKLEELKKYNIDIMFICINGKLGNMSVDDAIEFFGSQENPAAKKIAKKLQPLHDVGLGYIALGQNSSTLSGGESQRVKLAYFLGKENSEDNAPASKPILFIFDEPTTGLHFDDIEKLIKSFDALINKGHTIIVVEHNPYIIEYADYIIELGPEGGAEGGYLLTPQP
jgi:excinuclease ABC subunit A